MNSLARGCCYGVPLGLALDALIVAAVVALTSCADARASDEPVIGARIGTHGYYRAWYFDHDGTRCYVTNYTFGGSPSPAISCVRVTP